MILLIKPRMPGKQFYAEVHGKGKPSYVGHILDVATRKGLRSKSSRSPGYRKPGITGPRPRFGNVRPAYPIPASAPKPKRARAPRKPKAA
jgi:hypothetical protein